MPWRHGSVIFGSASNVITINQIDYLAEIILSISTCAVKLAFGLPKLSLVVWTLKCEVRAFGGCLGMYRRRRTWHAAISVGEL
jgi:hypothetical protein